MTTIICEQNLQDLGTPLEIMDHRFDSVDLERERQGLPLLNPAVEWCSEHGWQVIVDGMSHRGFVGYIHVEILACGHQSVDASDDTWRE